MKTSTGNHPSTKSIHLKPLRGSITQHWIKDYVGLPYREYNCFQLVQKILSEKYDFNLPDPPTSMKKNFEGLSEMIDDLFVDYLEPEPMQIPEEGCLVLMHGARNYNHLGLYVEVAGKGHVIHALSNARQSICHPISYLKRYGLKLEGFYRWL